MTLSAHAAHLVAMANAAARKVVAMVSPNDCAKLLGVASSQVGYYSGTRGASDNDVQKFSEETPGFAWSDGQPWCDTFVAWCFFKAGLTGEIAVSSASVAASRDAYKSAGRFSDYPAVGAQVIFGVNGDEHTGLVERFDADNIYTIEGNVTDGQSRSHVSRETHARRDSYVYGYGYPKYAEGIDSADPAWASSKPKPVPAPKPTPAPSPKPVAGRPWVWASVGFYGESRQTPGSIRTVQDALKKEFPKAIWADEYGVYWGSRTRLGYKWWQEKLGYSGADADGIPGKTSLTKLAAKYKFDIRGTFPSGPGVSGPPTVSGGGRVQSISVSSVQYDNSIPDGSTTAAAKAVCAMMGVPTTYWLPGILTAASRESSYSFLAVNGWDSNATGPTQSDGYPLHCSRGVMQCIPDTFAAYHMPGTSLNIYDGEANIAASMNYVMDRYGVSLDGSNLASNVQQFDPNRPSMGY